MKDFREPRLGQWTFSDHLGEPLDDYCGNLALMAIVRSRVTAQGQISVPSEVRRKLGVGPGSLLEWADDGENIVIRRVGRFTSEDIHRALFSDKALEGKSVDQMKEGIRSLVRKRHARD